MQTYLVKVFLCISTCLIFKAEASPLSYHYHGGRNDYQNFHKTSQYHNDHNSFNPYGYRKDHSGQWGTQFDVGHPMKIQTVNRNLLSSSLGHNAYTQQNHFVQSFDSKTSFPNPSHYHTQVRHLDNHHHHNHGGHQQRLSFEYQHPANSIGQHHHYYQINQQGNKKHHHDYLRNNEHLFGQSVSNVGGGLKKYDIGQQSMDGWADQQPNYFDFLNSQNYGTGQQPREAFSHQQTVSKIKDQKSNFPTSDQPHNRKTVQKLLDLVEQQKELMKEPKQPNFLSYQFPYLETGQETMELLGATEMEGQQPNFPKVDDSRNHKTLQKSLELSGGQQHENEMDGQQPNFPSHDESQNYGTGQQALEFLGDQQPENEMEGQQLADHDSQNFETGQQTMALLGGEQAEFEMEGQQTAIDDSQNYETGQQTMALLGGGQPEFEIEGQQPASEVSQNYETGQQTLDLLGGQQQDFEMEGQQPAIDDYQNYEMGQQTLELGGQQPELELEGQQPATDDSQNYETGQQTLELGGQQQEFEMEGQQPAIDDYQNCETGQLTLELGGQQPELEMQDQQPAIDDLQNYETGQLTLDLFGGQQQEFEMEGQQPATDDYQNYETGQQTLELGGQLPELEMEGQEVPINEPQTSGTGQQAMDLLVGQQPNFPTFHQTKNYEMGEQPTEEMENGQKERPVGTIETQQFSRKQYANIETGMANFKPVVAEQISSDLTTSKNNFDDNQSEKINDHKKTVEQGDKNYFATNDLNEELQEKILRELQQDILYDLKANSNSLGAEKTTTETESSVAIHLEELIKSLDTDNEHDLPTERQEIIRKPDIKVRTWKTHPDEPSFFNRHRKRQINNDEVGTDKTDGFMDGYLQDEAVVEPIIKKKVNAGSQSSINSGRKELIDGFIVELEKEIDPKMEYTHSNGNVESKKNGPNDRTTAKPFWHSIGDQIRTTYNKAKDGAKDLIGKTKESIGY